MAYQDVEDSLHELGIVEVDGVGVYTLAEYEVSHCS